MGIPGNILNIVFKSSTVFKATAKSLKINLLFPLILFQVKLLLVGWVFYANLAMEDEDVIAATSRVLSQADMPLVDLAECQKLIPGVKPLENEICAGEKEANKNPCMHSGNPS